MKDFTSLKGFFNGSISMSAFHGWKHQLAASVKILPSTSSSYKVSYASGLRFI
jgi:hypothetical protein